ncbi:MAG: LuxR C-terminal-related transcriptional regulator [Lachnospiraceae bacterium]
MEKEIYIQPEAAKKKMKAAQDIAQTVYLYGATGYGKSVFVKNYLKHRRYLYLNAGTVPASELLIPSEEEKMNGIKKESSKKIVVIDDVNLADTESVREGILELTQRKDIWLILVGRCKCPSWLLAAKLKHYPFMVIEENDLIFSREMIERYLSESGISVNEDTLCGVEEATRGHGMSVQIVAEILQDGRPFSEETIKQLQKTLWDYLDYHVYDQWDADLLEFTIQMSIVDSFTVPMAEHITGRTDVLYLIQKAEETGNFLREKEGIYTFDLAMLRGMRRRLMTRYTKEQRDELYYNAGLYYEQTGQVTEALKMYETCGNENRIGMILTENARKNPGSGYLYELRHYYLTLPEENIQNSIEMTAGMCMLQSILMNKEESERWYEILKLQEKMRTGNEKKAVRSWLAYLDIALPHRGSDNLIELMKNAFILLTNRQLSLPEFSVTSNLPSQMNGGKDFCEWSRRDRELAATIGKTVSVVLGKYGKGFVDNALAESFFEKGADSYEVISLATKGRMRAEAGGKLEQCFVSEAILARVHVINGHIAEATELMQHFRNTAVREGAQKLLSNIDTFLCRLFLYQDERAKISEWLETAPKEDEEFVTFDRYRYLTKVRCYLLHGRYDRAQSLLERLLCYAEMMDRPFIRMESNLLLSIVLYRKGDANWKDVFSEALAETEDYHFVRLISREGAAVWELLKAADYKAEDAQDEEKRLFRKQVLAETEQMALAYPAYLKLWGGSEEALSENAVKILRLFADGKTNAQIAALLCINENTVKYHCKQTYKKLGVSGRAEAVIEAKKRKII